MTGAIHQFVACAEAGAVGDHAVRLQRLIHEELGLPSEIFASVIRDSFPGQVKPLSSHPDLAGPGDRALYHLAIGSDVADYLLARPEPLAVYYHNLTPLRYVRPWDPAATYGVEWGLRQAEDLARRAEWAMAPSTFSAHELHQLGYGDITTLPLLIDLEGRASETDDSYERQLCTGREGRGSDWLFVGRLAANKCQHRVIAAFAAYRHLYDPAARLWLVGPTSSEQYADALADQIEALGLEGSATVVGPVPDRRLTAHYRRADVFVCLSEHEGFCVPILEAMWHSVPIVALAAAAVPGTIRDAGILLPYDGRSQPGAANVAAAVRFALGSRQRETLAAAGRARARSLAIDKTGPAVADALRRWASP
ncbi:MAG: glycosyltransferase family 4 protein [Acidimicrobiaceae bacterium]|nr:glycosyltransferase family 4 protein [Acidimicrobiaceae bacterium]